MRSKKTLAELTAWLSWDDSGAAPDAQALVDFLGISLAPEPEPPVGQRRRSPEGVEVIKTDDGTNSWRRYRGKACLSWFTGVQVADWEVITDAPEVPEDVIEAAAQWIAADVCPCDDECDSGCIGTGDRLARILADAGLLVGTTPDAPKCDREHLPEGHVPITFNGWSDDDLRVAARVVESGVLGASIRAELTNRGEGHASVCASCATELDTARDADGAP